MKKFGDLLVALCVLGFITCTLSIESSPRTKFHRTLELFRDTTQGSIELLSDKTTFKQGERVDLIEYQLCSREGSPVYQVVFSFKRDTLIGSFTHTGNDQEYFFASQFETERILQKMRTYGK